MPKVRGMFTCSNDIDVRRPRGRVRGFARWVMRRALVAALCTGLVLLSPGLRVTVLARAQGAPATLDEASAVFRDALGMVDDVRTSLDRTRFDVDALAFELAFSAPDEIAAWVRDHVAFQQYPGLLRGPQGTLVAGAGNALDLAVLLAGLLKDAGYEARVARGVLPENLAGRLVAQMAHRRPVPLTEGIPEAAYDVLDRFSSLGTSAVPDDDGPTAVPPRTPEPVDVASTERFRDAVTYSQTLVELLEREGLRLGGDATLEPLVEEAADYFWVEYRTGAQEAWQVAHPAFKDGEHLPEVPATERFEDAVPEALQHRLRVEVEIERKLGDEVTRTPIMSAWERPVANVVGVPLTFTNLPDGIETVTQLEELDDALVTSSYFVPLFNGRLPEGARLFDSLGNTVPPDAAASPYAGVFQELSSDAAAATSAIADLGSSSESDQEAVALVGQWLVLSLVAPDGSERTFRRPLLDRGIAPEPGSTGGAVIAPMDTATMGRELMSQFTFMVAPGALGEQYVLDASLQRFGGLAPLIEYGLAGSLSGDPEGARSKMPLDELDASWAGHLDLIATFDAPFEGRPDLISYRHEPTLVLHAQGVGDGLAVESSLDVLQNPRRTFWLEEGALVAAAEQNVLAGVWETSSEGARVGRGDDLARNAVALLEAPLRSGDGLEVIRSESQLGASELALSDAALGAVRRDLAAGFVAVVPVRGEPGHQIDAWWRVNVATGETLGMIDAGLGGQTGLEATVRQAAYEMLGVGRASYLAQATEDLTVRRIVFSTLAAGGVSFLGCYSIASDEAAVGVGCGICAAMLMAGMLLGYLVVIDAGFTVLFGLAVSAQQILVYIYARIMQAIGTGCSIVVTQFG